MSIYALSPAAQLLLATITRTRYGTRWAGGNVTAHEVLSMLHLIESDVIGKIKEN